MTEMLPWKSANPLIHFGHPLFVRPDCMDGDSLQSQIHEDEYGLRKIPIRSGDIVVDCGGYIGAVSALALSMGATVVCVEPLTSNCDLIRANTASWKDRFTLHHGALSAKIANVPIYQRSQENEYGRRNRHVAWSGNAQQEAGGTLIEEAKPVSLDLILSRLERIHLLKIDVEGGEWEIIPKVSAENWTKVERLVMEVHSPGLGIEGSLDDMVRLLRPFGFMEQKRHLLDLWLQRV